MATMTLSLPDPMKVWVEAQTESGRYGDAGDYVRDLIRRDQARQGAIAELQTLIDEGLSSGAAQPVDVDAFLAGKRAAQADR